MDTHTVCAEAQILFTTLLNLDIVLVCILGIKLKDSLQAEARNGM